MSFAGRWARAVLAAAEERLDALVAACAPDDRMPKGWTLEDALEAVRSVEPRMRAAGYFTGITGSVLHSGSSRKDLDVIVCPMDASAGVGHGPAYEVLRDSGWRQVLDAEKVRRFWGRAGSADTKHVEVWRTADGRRVDVFFLR